MTPPGTVISCGRVEGTSRGSKLSHCSSCLAWRLPVCLSWKQSWRMHSMEVICPKSYPLWHQFTGARVPKMLHLCSLSCLVMAAGVGINTLKFWIGQTSLSNWIPRSAVKMPYGVVPRLSCSTCFIQRVGKAPVWRTRDCQGPSL